MVYGKTVLFTILVQGFATVALPYILLSSGTQGLTFHLGVWRLVGVSLIVLGAGINLLCGWEFAFRGEGTPAVWDPPQTLVATGLYQYTRNPMYLGIDLLLLGEAVLFESWILLGYAILVGAGVYLVVLYYEEPTLARKFGVTYEVYRVRVPRWLPFPRVQSRSGE